MRLAIQQRSRERRGYVLFAVLIVVVVLSLAAYRYSESMSTELQVAVRTSETTESRGHANSGLYYAIGMLSDPDMVGTIAGNPYDNKDLFSGIAVGDSTGRRGGGRFALMNLADAGGTGADRYPLRYGVMDESAKLNINALILQDPSGEALYAALMRLPNMTEEIAAAMVDWVDADTTPRPNGAEGDVYQALTPPYACKNGPISSLEELLLVRGVTPQLLFGNDRNRNGILDPGEDDGTELNRGWCEYLTCYGREVNVDSTGAPRVDLNTPDLATLSGLLTPILGQDLSDYIVYTRATNKAVVIDQTTTATITSSDGAVLTVTTRFTPTPNQVVAPASSLRDLVQKLVDAKTQGVRKLSSTMTLYNTQIPLDPPPRPPGTPAPPTQVVACPLNDPAQLKQLLPLLLDKTSASTGYELSPRINVNTAPREVMLALPGLVESEVDNLISIRAGLTPNEPGTLSGAWIVTQANLSADKFKNIEKYISGRTYTYRIHSVGYFGKAGGAVARVEAVVDVALGKPRILYYRDLTDLGRGFPDANLPR